MKFKDEMGKQVFGSYEGIVTEGRRKAFSVVAEEVAADALLVTPYVSHHMIDHGIINRGENTRLSHLWKVNLYGQYYAHGEGKLHMYDVENAHNRAKVVIEYVYKTSPRFREMLKKNRKTIQDAYTAMRQAALVESLQCAYIAGTEISDVARIAAETSLLKRFTSESKRFREMIESMGFNPADIKEVRDASKLYGDFRTPITKAWNDVTYFQRRKNHFNDVQKSEGGLFEFIDEEVPQYKNLDKDDSIIDLKRHTRKGFTEAFFADMAKASGLDVEKIITELGNGENPRMF